MKNKTNREYISYPQRVSNILAYVPFLFLNDVRTSSGEPFCTLAKSILYMFFDVIHRKMALKMTIYKIIITMLNYDLTQAITLNYNVCLQVKDDKMVYAVIGRI
jgi:hypothetical protein